MWFDCVSGVSLAHTHSSDSGVDGKLLTELNLDSNKLPQLTREELQTVPNLTKLEVTPSPTNTLEEFLCELRGACSAGELQSNLRASG